MRRLGIRHPLHVLVLTQRLFRAFLNFKFASMASMQCHVAATPSRRPSESLRSFATVSVPHRSGLEAKSRTEDETGIVFLQPQHMQHGVYTILSRWWTTKKKELKKQLEMCDLGVLWCCGAFTLLM